MTLLWRFASLMTIGDRYLVGSALRNNFNNSIGTKRSIYISSAHYDDASANQGDEKSSGNANDQSGAILVTTGPASGVLPSAFDVPEKWPIVPVIVTKRPLFPLFYKEIIVKHPELMDIIRKKVRVNQPYAGVFLTKNVHRNSTNAETQTNVANLAISDVTKSLDEIHKIGTFVRIHGFRDMGNMLHMVLSGHRRIKIIRSVDVEKDSLKNSSPFLRSKRDKFPKLALPSRTLDSNTKDESSAKEEPSPKEDSLILLAEVENFEEEISSSVSEEEEKDQKNELVALRQEVIQTIHEIMILEPKYREHPALILQAGYLDADNPVHMADLGATIFGSSPEEMQQVLEEESVPKRLKLTLMILKKCLEILKIQQKLRSQIDEDIAQRHRKYLLGEQLKLIKKELGLEKDDKDAVAERFRARIADKKVPENVLTIIDEELSKLSMLDNHSSEFSVIRNYLDILTSLPWGRCTKENLDLRSARVILDQDHYGLEQVKERILEFLAVTQLKKSAQGQILCLHGPPGVGKTSIAKSVARALNREYYRFSVGGMSDVAEIKGHRRTYVGAMPGKLVQCLKRTKSENPLVLIDEVDKMGRGIHGDPSAALLELLDPEQNSNFLDHYLDVPIDLSRVLFICTANYTETIPDPLKDRMDMLEISGYKPEEKLVIAQRYLIPLKRKAAGLTDKQLQIDDSVIKELINTYCTKEQGVRNLQKHIEKIMRKAAFKIVEHRHAQNRNSDSTSSPDSDDSSSQDSDISDSDDDIEIRITMDNMKEFLGDPIIAPGIGFTLNKSKLQV